MKESSICEIGSEHKKIMSLLDCIRLALIEVGIKVKISKLEQGVQIEFVRLENIK